MCKMQVLDIKTQMYFEMEVQSGSDVVQYRRPVHGTSKDWVRVWGEGRIHDRHEELEELLLDTYKNKK